VQRSGPVLSSADASVFLHLQLLKPALHISPDVFSTCSLIILFTCRLAVSTFTFLYLHGNDGIIFTVKFLSQNIRLNHFFCLLQTVFPVLNVNFYNLNELLHFVTFLALRA